MEELIYDKCPYCVGGMALSDHRAEMVPCTHCYGKNVVIVNYVCACGRPCRIVSADQFLYCGEKTCLADLRITARQEKYEEEFQPNHYYDHVQHKWVDNPPAGTIDLMGGYGFGMRD